jgi:fused signal recognition particle receptor
VEAIRHPQVKWLAMFANNTKASDKPAEQGGFLKRLRARLNKGDSWLTYDLANLAPGGSIDEDVLEELESLLIMADVGVETTATIIRDLQARLAR